MLYWAAVFFIIAAIAGALGFSGVAMTAARPPGTGTNGLWYCLSCLICPNPASRYAALLYAVRMFLLY